MKSGGPKIKGLTGNFENWRISKKLPAVITFFAIAVGISVGIASDFIWSSAIEKEVSQKLETALAGRAQSLENYFGSIREDLGIVAANPTAIEALKEFTDAWHAMEVSQTQALQHLYINQNPFPAGERDKLVDAGDGSAYSAVHARFHPWFHKFQRDREYYDVFLFDTEGNLVYTVFKELDYATNMLYGQWADTDLANVFRDSAANPRSGYESFYDFRPYAPSFDAPASFISAPVLDNEGTPLGVLAFQMPIGRINAIMGNVEGMGESGESYIVGSDYLMRSDSRFSEESTILKRTVDGATVKAAIAGRTGVEKIEDYRGIPVMSAYRPFEFLGAKWAILAEVDAEELNQPIVALRSTLLMVCTAVIVVIGFLGFLVARGIARPIGELTGVMSILADGNNEVDIPYTDRGDEIGQMATTVDVFKQNAIERREMEEQLRQAQKMEAIGLLTSGIAHYLNNILTTIIGNFHLLEEEISGKNEYASFVTTGISAAWSGAKLTEQLLAFSRQQMLNPRTTDLNELIVKLTGLMRRTVGKTINVTTELESGLWPARIDRKHFSSALLNLAINSRDAMATGGELVIRTANRRLGEEEARIHDDLEPGAYVSVSVSDTGIGMTPDVQSRAFDPFFTNKDFGESTGLGLSTVYGFARQSGGDVTLTSEQGVGSTVELLFPVLEDTMTPLHQSGTANSQPR